MSKEKIETVNQKYYNQLYEDKNPLLHLVHSIVSFDQQAKSKPNWHLLRSFVSKDLPSFKMLDYGSGWGTFLLKLPRPTVAYCFDLSHHAMSAVQKAHALLGRRVELAEIDQENNITPKEFDLIVCSHVLEHVPDDLKLLQKFSQALKPKGLVLINVPINETWYDPKHIRAYTKPDLHEKLCQAGFKPVAENQVDKWTGFLLERELDPYGIPIVSRILLRIVRLILALTPLQLTQKFEDLFLAHRPFQQLLIIGQKIS
ncbi:MAG: class I SAM-dependent methyltransferase [Anaerolineaceae bacterium]|nr:class I SAM-dependent methyltransferase [Anaerolineaceae bacterium]